MTVPSAEGLGLDPVLGRAPVEQGVEQGFHAGIAGQQRVFFRMVAGMVLEGSMK